MSKRLAEFDLIRAGTALAVVAIHVTAGYMDLSLGYICNHLVRFAVPLFIVISGFLLYWTDQGNPFVPTRQFYQKRLHKILGPYVIWTCLYCLLNFYLLRLSSPWLFLTTLGNSLLWGNAYYHLYFLIIILQLYLLYPFLRNWMLRSARSLLGASLLISGTVQILLYLYLLGVITLPARYSLLYVRAFPVWLFYFVFGMYAAAQFMKTRPKETGLSPALVLWMVSLIIMLLDSKLSGIQGSIVRPSVMLYAIASYYFFYALARSSGPGKGLWIGWLSAQSFLIYLMHPLVMTSLTILTRHLGYPSLWTGSQGMLLFYGATVAITIMATYLVSRTPLANILGGVRT